MNEVSTIPSIEALKAQAKRLRAKLAGDGKAEGKTLTGKWSVV